MELEGVGLVFTAFILLRIESGENDNKIRVL
jgi:hypothetical protein